MSGPVGWAFSPRTRFPAGPAAFQAAEPLEIATSRELFNHAIDIGRRDVKMRRGADPAGPRCRADSGHGQLADDLRRVHSRLAKTDDSRARLRGAGAQQFI